MRINHEQPIEYFIEGERSKAECDSRYEDVRALDAIGRELRTLGTDNITRETMELIVSQANQHIRLLDEIAAEISARRLAWTTIGVIYEGKIGNRDPA